MGLMRKKTARATASKKIAAKKQAAKLNHSARLAKLKVILHKQPIKKSATLKHTAAAKHTSVTHAASQPRRLFIFGVLGRARSIFVWSLVVVSVLAVLSVVASYGNEDQSETSVFRQKLPQASMLNLLNTDEPITLIATGDVMLARYVELQMRTLKDYTFPFRKVSDFLKNADITIANLETPLMPGKNVPTGSMTFRADPEALAGLLAAGFDVVSIANNHTMNYQVPGLTSTLQALKKAGILAAGGGRDLDVAHTPAIMEVKGKKIAFYSYVDNSIPPGHHGAATKNTPGIAVMDTSAVKSDVKNARDTYGADIVIVSMHAGKEYTREPTQFQKDFAHAAVDAGASVVIGHHPHWIQPVENYMDGVIFYSLGNFVFDQSFSDDVKTGLVAKITFDGVKPVYELFPVKIEKTQPRILEGDEKDKEITRLGLK